MSWGIEITGTKDAVKAKLSTECARIAASYDGKPEADDVRTFEARALALIDAIELGPTGYGGDWNAVRVKGGGSHSSGPSGLWSASMSMEVVRVSLAL